MRPRLVALAATCALLAASGCTGSPDESSAPGDGSPTPGSLPGLAPAWTVDLAGPATPLEADVGATGTRGELTTWTAGDELVLVTQEGLTGIDTTDGTVTWSWEVPQRLGPVCRAGEPLEAAQVVLLFGSGQDCTAVGRFDLAAHELTWSRRLGTRSDPVRAETGADVRPEDANVWGDTSRVVVPEFCRGVRALDAATGRPVRTGLETADCRLEAQVAGERLVVLDQRSDEPRLSLRDPGAGPGPEQVVWQRPWPGLGRLDGVLSTDPLVLDVTVDGHRVLAQLDERGQLVRYVGREMAYPPLSLGSADGTLAVSFDLTTALDRSARFRGYDLATGEESWTTTPQQALVLGRVGDDVLLAGDGSTGALADETTLVLGRAPLSDPTDQRSIGTVTVPGQPGVDTQTGWTDTTFLVLRDGELAAYPLEASDQPLPQVAQPEPELADGDLTAEQTTDLCTQVGPTTLTSLGIDQDGFPTPADCHWVTVTERAGSRNLFVETFRLDPGEGRSAVERAGDALQQLLEQDRTGPNHTGDPTALTDVGDEAFLAQGVEDGKRQVRLAVRYRNVVLLVTANAQGTPRPDVTALRDGALQVARDLVTALGGDATE